MNDVQLTARLVECIMGWRTSSDRFIKPGRSWIPRWRFNPLQRFDDALKLLDAATPAHYIILFSAGRFQVEVEIKGNIGRATGASRPRTIVLALARSLKLGDVAT